MKGNNLAIEEPDKTVTYAPGDIQVGVYCTLTGFNLMFNAPCQYCVPVALTVSRPLKDAPP